MQPIPVSILFSLFIASSVVCNEQSPELNLQGNVHGRHFLNPSKITSNVVSSVSSNAAKGIGGVANQAADTETKLGNAVSSGINGVGKLASAGSNGDADAVEFFAKMKGDAVRAIGDIAAYNGNRTSADIKRAGRMANCILSELGLAPLGSFVKDATNQLGDVESVIGSVVDEEFDTLGAFVAGEEIGNKINTSISVKVVKQLGDAISSGINGVGELASSGSNMTASVAQSLLGDELGSAIGQGINGLGPLTPGLASLVNLVSVFASKIGSAADKKFDALGDLNVVGGKAIGNKIKGLGSAVENGFKAGASVADMGFGLKANAIKGIGGAAESLANGLGKAAGAKGDALADGASKAGQMAESGVKAASDAAGKVAGDVAGKVDSAVGAITDGASKAGEMASNGVKAAGDAAGKAVGALTGAVSGLFG